jgi:threonine dehydrogenase-like Zn-dependent dehydrogenase
VIDSILPAIVPLRRAGEGLARLADLGVKLPLTMGHENVGKVVAVGPNAKGLKGQLY